MFAFRVLGFHSSSFDASRSLKYQNSLWSESSWVLGIPWDVDTDGLRRYIAKFGDLEGCIVMKEEMRSSAKKVTRIFVVKIPPSVTEAAFRSHFEKYGDIKDLYLPKDQGLKEHHGIGFITFASAGS